MEKPPRAPFTDLPSNPSPSASSASSSNEQEQERMRMATRKAPSPEELVAHYESQGVDPKEAPLKVIEDLQSVILRVIGSSGRATRDKFMANTTRKLDNINTRLAVLDMKLDSKPGYPQALAIGVSAGATVGLLPYLATAFAQMWQAVRSLGRRPT